MPPSRKAGLPGQQRQHRLSSHTNGSSTQSSRPRDEDGPLHALPFEVQQIILNIFCVAAPVAQDTEDLNALIQEVKGHLFNRDFRAAFGKPAHLEAYALRWSAARALGYATIFTDPNRKYLLGNDLPGSRSETESTQTPQREESVVVEAGKGLRGSGIDTFKSVVCIGGGAGAEVVALAAAHKSLGDLDDLEIIAVDDADWTGIIEKLNDAFYMPVQLSPHASAAARARPENQPLLGSPSNTRVRFLRQDALAWDLESLQQMFQNTTLCTIMFTLNELFSASLPKATALLLHITTSMPPGGHLLVVDSPGSYSEIQLRKKESENRISQAVPPPAKKYPMKWLLDHTLLETASDTDGPKWQKIESEDSLWFRIDQKDRTRLKHPLELENMRYQLHCYRRL